MADQTVMGASIGWVMDPNLALHECHPIARDLGLHRLLALALRAYPFN